MKLFEAVVVIAHKGDAFKINFPLPNGIEILSGTKPLIISAESEIPEGKVSNNAFEPLDELRKVKGVARIGIFAKGMFIEKDGIKSDGALLRLIVKTMKKICAGKKVAFVAVNEAITADEVADGFIWGTEMYTQARLFMPQTTSAIQVQFFWGSGYPGP